MDLDEWELLPDDGFLQIHDDGGNKIFSRKYGGDHHPKTVFKTNYFICPSPKSPSIADPPASDPRPRVVLPNQLGPVPIDHEYDELVKQVTNKVMADQKVTMEEETGVDQDTVSQQVFFKKMKENEFVDMKMDSPKSSGRGIVPGTFQFEERSSDHQAYKGDAAMEAGKPGSKSKIEKEKNGVSRKAHQLLDSETAEEKEEKNSGMNIWRWSLTGIGAICSFGVAAATICIIILGSHNHQNKQQHQHNQKLRFQIYADDKRIKQVVHHATKLNEAISAVRGVSVPLTRAHITIGGYYDGL
ncbi:hypothetical protein U1Q18_012702 [Sarracenia purpurea var. burkii]